MVLGIDYEDDTMLKQIQKEKEKLMYDLMVSKMCFFYLFILFNGYSVFQI